MCPVQPLKKNLHSALLNKHLKIYHWHQLIYSQTWHLVDEHEEDSIENDEEYWNTPPNIDDSSGSEEEEGIILNT